MLRRIVTCIVSGLLVTGISLGYTKRDLIGHWVGNSQEFIFEDDHVTRVIPLNEFDSAGIVYDQWRVNGNRLFLRNVSEKEEHNILELTEGNLVLASGSVDNEVIESYVKKAVELYCDSVGGFDEVAYFDEVVFADTVVADPWVDYVQTSRNPIVDRIDPSEVAENRTPAALAYNYVKAVLDRNFDKMVSLSSRDTKNWQVYTGQEWLRHLLAEHNGDVQAVFDNCFSEGKLGILGWKPALENGYEVAVAYIQDESSFYGKSEIEDAYYWYIPGLTPYRIEDGMIYLEDETEPHETQITKKIYITCSPSEEVGKVGFQDIGRYGNTNVKVLVSYDPIEHKWAVDGFK